jgi:hypothetical protein
MSDTAGDVLWIKPAIEADALRESFDSLVDG